MKKLLLFFLSFACAAGAFAGHGNKIFMKRPQASWNNLPAGIKDVSFEVRPLGIYALVDMTFSVGPGPNTSPTDSQEAVIFFDLPEGSYVYDSWLWLNPTTIISAELMERRKASEIYTGIVRRRRDPSLLYNVLGQNYQLNVYPVSSGYWRKVKVSYATPVQWEGGRAQVPLPLELLAGCTTPPAISLNVHTNGAFYNPAFAERPFGSWVTNTTGNSVELAVPASGYTGASGLTLSFEHYHQVESRLSTTPTGPNEGIYELIVPPVAKTPAPPRYLNFVIDHLATKEIYSPAEIRRMVRHLLGSGLSPADYFNIYFRNTAGTIVSLYNTWHAADSAGINSIGAAFGGPASQTETTLTGLLKAAMLFTATGPANAETIILNGNYLPVQTTANANNVLASLSAAPGIFSRKARVLDYRYSAVQGQTSMPPDAAVFHDLLARIADATGGTYYAPPAFYYDPYTQSTIYDLNLQDALRRTADAGLQQTAAFQVLLPVAGFTYAEFGISTGKSFSPYATYTESGKYYGSFNTPDSIRFSYSAPSGLAGGGSALSGISAGDSIYKKTWNYHNNKALAGFGTTYRQEIINSSIRHRVLSDFTAFLALETGDTIKASVGQSIAGGFPLPVSGTGQPGTLIAYPNPFRNVLTIESTDEIQEVRIYTVSGSLVMTAYPTGGIHQWTWDGTDNNGSSLPPGIYLIRVSGNGRSTAIRVNRQD